MEPVVEFARDDTWVPGTVRLEDVSRTRDQLVLFPVPTEDPDDPLNWSTARKYTNFGIASFFVLWTFVQLDIAFTSWGPMIQQYNFSITILNAGAACNWGGLAVGVIFFTPFVHKYGRRPIYLFSTATQLAACIWFARIQTTADLLGSNILSGLGGAMSEIVVQITIADVFFVHQHATMNGWFMIVQSLGAFLGPVPAGYCVSSMGWRWIWWWCVIFLAVTLVAAIFFFEETKYIPSENCPGISSPCAGTSDYVKEAAAETETAEKTSANGPVSENVQFKRKSYRQRMALVSPTSESILSHYWQPIVILLRFPAVSYCAITYGSTLCWFAIMTSLQATYMIEPPYNFSSVGIGLMNLAPFVGTLLGFPYGGYLCDKSILWLSKRNGGIYEPEMRLWLALPLSVILVASILMFGIGLAHAVPWPLIAVGFGFWGFTIGGITGISLSYLMDCYQDIIGDALVGVIFFRNAISLIVLNVLTFWVTDMGLQNVHIICAVLAFVIYLIPVALLIWGKAARRATAPTYKKMAAKQVGNRTIG